MRIFIMNLIRNPNNREDYYYLMLNVLLVMISFIFREIIHEAVLGVEDNSFTFMQFIVSG
jgi:hypothetical protein